MSRITISQTTSLSKEKVFVGIPITLNIPEYPFQYPIVNLFDADDGTLIFSYNTGGQNNVNILLYNNFDNIDYGRSYLFSTSSSISPRYVVDVDGGILDFFGQPNSNNQVISPTNVAFPSSISNIIQFTNYYESLTTVNAIDLNMTVNQSIGWSKPNTNYGNDTVRISMIKDDSAFFNRIGNFTNNQTIRNDQLVNLRSGNYYFYYDFGYNVNINFFRGDNSNARTKNTFIFITERLRNVVATGGANSTPVLLTINVGYGFPSYTYTITIKDTNNISSSTTDDFPFTFTSSLSTTMTYTVTVSNSQDEYDTNTVTTTFTAYKNVNFSIANKIIQSSQNYLTWTGGSLTEFFQYVTPTTSVFPIPNSNSNRFDNGNALDARMLTKGTGYSIQPVEGKVNSQNYGFFYFDSIENYQSQNQKLIVSGTDGPFLSTSPSTLTWDAYYTDANTAPGGLREYNVTIGGFTGKSKYNKLTLSSANVNYGIPYTINVLDVTIATNYKFYQKPYEVTITPGYINYPNTITWISSTNPQLNIGIGTFQATINSPSIVNLIQSKINIDTVNSINFWPPDLLPVNAVSCLTVTLSANTFTFWDGGTVPYYQDVTFSIVIGSYIYNDTFLLKHYRKDGTFVQDLETITKTTPFTYIFKPSNYDPFLFQADDRLRLQSVEHLNYGLSGPFTFYKSTATVTLDGSNYNIFSTITATLNIEAETAPSFRVYLHSNTNEFTDILLTTLTKKKYSFQPATFPLNSAYLNKDVSLLYKLDNYPTETIESPPFRLFQNATVTLDQPNYTIISTIVSTLNIPTVSQYSFTVQLIDGTTSYPIDSNVQTSTFSFKPYSIGNVLYVDKNVYLQFILNGSPSIVIRSAEFQISSTYFSLDNPQLTPEFARATSNVICVTQKKNNVPTAIISIKDRVATPTAVTGQAQYVVPCGILSYIDELNGLLPTMSIRSSLLFLIQKYSIPIPSKAVVNKKRYQYPTADAKQLHPILQYTTTFRLGENTLGYSVNQDPSFIEKIYDARILSIANNDAKTVSSYYTDMLVNATTWLNTLPPLTKDGSYFYCVVRPINGTANQFISATISLLGNQLIFTPFISRYLLLLYIPYQEGDITILYSSSRFADVVEYMKSTFYQDFLDGQTAL